MDIVYSPNEIKSRLSPIFHRHGVKRAILFGSYSKGLATKDSDVDIVVDSGLKGLKFVGLIEDVREALDKEVDVFDVTHIEQDSLVAKEIQESGQEIYEG